MTTSNGLLLVDKPRGLTSHDVVARVRRILHEKKVGHAGTLDPMATGLLVLAVGPSTRLLRFAQSEVKHYEGAVKFGVATDSLDADGAVVDERTGAVARQRRRVKAAATPRCSDAQLTDAARWSRPSKSTVSVSTNSPGAVSRLSAPRARSRSRRSLARRPRTMRFGDSRWRAPWAPTCESS